RGADLPGRGLRPRRRSVQGGAGADRGSEEAEALMSVLLVDKRESIATVTLNRPQAMNALSSELRNALVDAFADVARDESVGAVILTGAGKAFCAGLDLKEIGGESRERS